MITVNDAYNKGLDTAENEAYEKISKAMERIDAGSFANPKMEELRQELLNRPETHSQFVIDFFKKNDIDETQLSSLDLKILELLKFCKRIVPKRPSSKISVGLRDKITAIEVDIIKNNDKLD
jgi:hypothetical protein